MRGAQNTSREHVYFIDSLKASRIKERKIIRDREMLLVIQSFIKNTFNVIRHFLIILMVTLITKCDDLYLVIMQLENETYEI